MQGIGLDEVKSIGDSTGTLDLNVVQDATAVAEA
jgi:hypothetical protein